MDISFNLNHVKSIILALLLWYSSYEKGRVALHEKEGKALTEHPGGHILHLPKLPCLGHRQLDFLKNVWFPAIFTPRFPILLHRYICHKCDILQYWTPTPTLDFSIKIRSIITEKSLWRNPLDRSQSLFYFVPQDSHSQAGSTRKSRKLL